MNIQKILIASTTRSLSAPQSRQKAQRSGSIYSRPGSSAAPHQRFARSSRTKTADMSAKRHTARSPLPNLTSKTAPHQMTFITSTQNPRTAVSISPYTTPPIATFRMPMCASTHAHSPSATTMCCKAQRMPPAPSAAKRHIDARYAKTHIPSTAKNRSVITIRKERPLRRPAPSRAIHPIPANAAAIA